MFFLPRDAKRKHSTIAVGRCLSVCPSVRVSVCLSVRVCVCHTRVVSKRLKLSQKNSRPGSTTILGFLNPSGIKNSRESLSEGIK